LEGLDFSLDSSLYMPSDMQVESNLKNGKYPKERSRDYWAISAHEMGHVLGLSDAYSDKDATGETVDRMVESGETCIVDGKTYQNIMKSNNVYAIANDIQMILVAYSKAIMKDKKAYQAYNKYTWKENSIFYDCSKSSAIKTKIKDDEKPE
jgi:hypothetical protein